MNLNEEFDELARRKLEERAFPFAEADWQDARKRIDAERGGRIGAKWITGAAALLLISGLVWYGTRPAGTENAVAAIEQAEPSSVEQSAPDQPAQNETATPKGAPSQASAPTSADDVMAPSIKSIPVHSVDQAPERPTDASTTTIINTPPKKEELHTSGAIPPTAISYKEDVANKAHIAIPNEESKEAASTSEFTASRSDAHSATTSAAEPRSNGDQIGSVDPKAETTTQKDPIVSNATSSTSADQAKEQDQPTLALSETEGDKQGAGSETRSDDLQTKTDGGANTGDPRFMVPSEVPSRTTTNQPPSPTDTTTNIASIQLPGDSANTAAAAPAPPLLLPERAPWEVSVLGGGFSSKSHYAGSNSADWSGNISSEKSIGVGAELMHIGRNFGIGTGLYYGNYAERIRTDAIDVTTSTLHNYWYLTAVDTTVLVITDTVPGTPPTYTGTSGNTTVHVLTQGTDTTTTSQHLRDARDQVNRVSYLEVPILLDVHLTQGRWMLGLRGGPTIGLLTGRRGAVPAPDNEGYLSFTDLPFRELTLGYTARAYVRYRFNAAWSVGVEPAMRGQLLNSLGNGDLVRRSSALGVMMSLTYRLR